MRVIPVEFNWHTGMSIYASESFLKSVSDEYGWIGGISDSGTLLCIQPYMVIRKMMFRLIRFPVQTIPLEDEFDVEQEREFLNCAVDYFRSIGSDVIIPATFNTLFRTYPDGAMVAPYGSYILDLSQSEDVLWSNIHSKHRNTIRNAMKNGVKIRNGIEYLETAYRLVQDSFSRSANGLVNKLRLKARMDYATFNRQVLALGENVKIFVAEYGGRVHGCAVIPFSNYSAYYMHGGSVSDPITGAMNLLQWEAIRQFQGLGVRHYDFFGARINPEKGSKMEGILRFKERFGGQLVTGYMWKLSFCPLKKFLYSMATLVRSGGDVVDQEYHKLTTGFDSSNSNIKGQNERLKHYM